MSGPEAFTDSNASPAVAVGDSPALGLARARLAVAEDHVAKCMGGIGDVNSDARGSGARYNVGKPAIDLIPLRLVADSFADPQRDRGSMLPATLAALYAVGEFQETHDRRALDAAIRYLSPYWEQCARVFDYGQREYATWNWAKGMSWTAVVGSFGRHAVAKLRGEDYDPESKQMHEGHMLCNLVMLRMYADIYLEGNDLPPPKLFGSAITHSSVAPDPEFGRSVVVYGPKGCGKDRNARALAEHFNVTRIVYDWDGSKLPRLGVLALTTNVDRAHAATRNARVFDFRPAMELAGLAVQS